MNRATVFDRNPSLPQPPGRPGWARSFAPILDDLRRTLRARDPQQIAARSGATWDPSAPALHLDLIGRPYCLTWPALVAHPPSAADPAPADVQGLLLYYLTHADGAPPANQWVTFRELPEGWLYHRAFQGYTGDLLAGSLGGVAGLDRDAAALGEARLPLGDTRLPVGDRVLAVRCLPRLTLSVIYWEADDEFPARAQILFDAGAGHYLTTDGLAILGSLLVRRLLGRA